MFSDKFVEINNYSLLRKEYLNTSSVMPWRYTSVYDPVYKPEISEEIKNKFQLFFYYRLQYTPQILEDDNKYLEITHKDNTVQEYRAINPIKLPFFLDPAEWYHFIHSLEISNLNDCKQKIFDYVKDSLIVSGITSVTYDKDCNATGVYFQHDPKILLEHSEMADKLCDISTLIRSTTTVHINPENNKIRYSLIPRYGSRAFKLLKLTEKSKYDASNHIPIRVKNQPQTEKVLQAFRDSDLLTDEMVDYIKEVMPEETKLSFEYIINESGEIDDIILKNVLIEEFGDVSKKQDHPMYDILEKRYLL